MDNLGDWIYIVFLVVAALSGLFSSKSKKKRPTQVLGQPEYDTTQEEPTPSGKGFWEILEEVTAERPKQKTVTETLPNKKKNKKDIRQPNPFLAAEQEIHQAKAGSPRFMSFPTEEDHSLLEDIEFNNAEELRKAVIYSEILNRKY